MSCTFEQGSTQYRELCVGSTVSESCVWEVLSTESCVWEVRYQRVVCGKYSVQRVVCGKYGIRELCVGENLRVRLLGGFHPGMTQPGPK